MATNSPTRGVFAYRRLASSLGLPPGVLSILAIDPQATVESAARIVSESIGARAYRRLDPAASVPARGSAVLAGLRAMRAADREPIEPALRRATLGEQEPADPRQHAKPSHKPRADPSREATIDRIVASTGHTRADVAASMAALGFNGRASASTPSAAVARASSPRAASPSPVSVSDADRRLAAEHGYDPADVARSRAALGFGGTS